jgi:hypothetical protein
MRVPGASGEKLDFDAFVEFAKQDVGEDVEALQAGGDIHPRAYIWGPAGGGTAAFPPLTETTKLAIFHNILPGVVISRRPALFACALTVYSTLPKQLSEFTDGDRRAFIEERELPDWPPRGRWRRREEVLLSILAHEREASWQAPVIRPYGSTPLLGCWGTLGRERCGGELLRNVRRALQRRQDDLRA